jgi:glycerate 2-kinase
LPKKHNAVKIKQLMESLLKQHLIQIRTAALSAVDPAKAVRNFMHLETDKNGARLHIGNTTWELHPAERLLLVAAGKAAAPMAQATAEICGKWLHGGILVTKYGHAAGHNLSSNLQIYEAGHPVPDQAGLEAAKAVSGLLGNTAASDRLILLLSGGASALLPLPVAGITLEELQSLTALLLRAGATIGELNAVRKHLDQMKGGQLARQAAPAALAALILSDVVGDPLDVIASGPTVPDSTTYQDAWEILKRYRLTEQTPASIRAHLETGGRGLTPETPKAGDPAFVRVSNQIIGSNRLAALAAQQAAEHLGYRSMLLSTFVEGEARQVARVAAALAKGIRYHGDPFPPPACLIFGGETTVTLKGTGKGGRNQELALAAAVALQGIPSTALMALATDGSDGPTDSAGAIIDGETIALARRLGLDPIAALANNDAYPLLEAAGAQMHTGPTGTNVNDLVVILVR